MDEVVVIEVLREIEGVPIEVTISDLARNVTEHVLILGIHALQGGEIVPVRCGNCLN